MIILHVLSTATFSGAENVVCQIINIFKNDLNIKMYYCSLDGPIRNILIEKQISFIPIKSLSYFEIKKVIRQIHPDIIHAHDMRASFITSMACKNIKLISHIHNNNFDSRKISLKSIAYILAGFKSKHIIWVSKSSFDGYIFHSLFIKKSVVLYNTINVDTLYHIMRADTNKYDYDLVFVGRLNVVKNPLRIIRICANIVKRYSKLKVAILGNGELAEQMRAMTIENNLSHNIDYYGFQNNPFKIIHNSKMMIMTSITEGTPMCALESIALGTPIISTPVGGMVDLIDDKVNGYLCETDQDFEDTIVSFLINTILQESFRKACIAKSECINDSQKYRISLLNLYNS